MAYMVVTPDVSKLSGWLNADASCRGQRRAHDAGQSAGRQAGGRVGRREGVGRRRRERHARQARLKAGGQGTGRAHVKHLVHGRDAGGVEAQRLVERIRVLPSRRGGIRCGARGGPGGERAWREDGASDMHTGRVQLKWHAYAERTVNMALISVTLDVSKLSGWLNAYADCRVERRACEAGRGESREAGGSEAAAAQAACTARGHARSAPGTCDTWS